MSLWSRILVPLDGSKLAERAIPVAAELSRLTGAKLELLWVIDLSSKDRFGDFGLSYDYEMMDKAIEEERKLANAYLSDRARGLGEGHLVATRIVSGIAAKEIVRLTHGGDLIVMATHGRTGIKRLLIGSVAEEVLRHAVVPIVLVRAFEGGPRSTVATT